MSVQLGDVPAETDVLVIGSGFGGSVFADQVARSGRSVVVLERGKAYPPGSFPRTPAEFGGNFWSPDDGMHGMFDVWTFRGINAIVSSGLGGGSLIYANVMIRKPPDWFTQPHPTIPGLQERWSFGYRDLCDFYCEVEKFLDVQELPKALAVPKTAAFIAAAGGLAKYAPLAVRFRDADDLPVVGAPLPEAPYDNIFGLPRRTCCMVGECDIGCNVGAKSTMDHTYLSSASSHGASIHVRTEVRTIVRNTDHFAVGYVVHRPGDEASDAGEAAERPERSSWVKRDEPVRYIKAQEVVLGAGSIGTSYLLLRNQRYLSMNLGALGTRFCGNGDLLGFLMKSRQHLDSTNGPVITAYAPYHGYPDVGDYNYGMYIEDAGYPMFVNWLLQAPGIVSRLGPQWMKQKFFRFRPDTSFSKDLGVAIGNASLTNNALPLLGMGRDIPDGRFFLSETDQSVMDSTWTIKTSKPYFEEMRRRMTAIADGLGGRFLVNPQYFLGRVISVHPLGGVPADTLVGDTVLPGVVDTFGRVHGVDGLWVCDGSAFPGPVGPNPSLTIAAFAHRAAAKMLGHL